MVKVLKKNKTQYPRIIIAGTQSGVGKTTLTLGILAALKKRKISVQPFKVGPDYIDTAYHSKLVGRTSRNLDSYLLDHDGVRELFTRQAQEVDFSVIEGVMGLYDGAGIDGASGSTADVAAVIRSPVILVFNGEKIAHSAAAQILGYQKYSTKLMLAGCIANNVSSSRHYAVLKCAIEKRTAIPLLGYLPKDKQLHIPQRHLGLEAAQESNLRSFTPKLVKLIEKYIDLDALIKIGNQAKVFPQFKRKIFPDSSNQKQLHLAVARDKCFHFYYQDNLDILKHYGIKLSYFSPLKDKALPGNSDGVYIGGGFPELFARQLSTNRSMLASILEKSKDSMPIYAECGGLMYLMKDIAQSNKLRYKMVGIFPATVHMAQKLQSFGYHTINSLSETIISKKGDSLKGHMFHWSYLRAMPKSYAPVFSLSRLKRKLNDGYLKNNTLVSYVHIHFGTDISWAKKFIRSCEEYKRKRAENGS